MIVSGLMADVKTNFRCRLHYYCDIMLPKTLLSIKDPFLLGWFGSVSLGEGSVRTLLKTPSRALQKVPDDLLKHPVLQQKMSKRGAGKEQERGRVPRSMSVHRV